MLIMYGIVGLLMPFIYAACYYANYAGGTVIYLDPTNSSRYSREAPRYRIAQEVSEVVFWPAYKIDDQFLPRRRYQGGFYWRDDWR